MKKVYVVVSLLMLIIGMLAGCSSNGDTKHSAQSQKTEKTAFPVTIKDGSGDNVTIKQTPKRIVSLVPSNTEIAYKLGLGKEIIGVSDSDDYPKDVKKKTKIGGTLINVEKVIALKPDLVLANVALTSPEAIQQLQSNGIKVLVVNDATNFDQVYQSIKMVGKATGTSEKAANVVKKMQQQLAVIKEKTASVKNEKTVYIEISPSPDIYAAGKHTFMDQMLKTIHAKNAVTENNWPKLNEEEVIKLNPDVIITTYGDSTKNAPQQVLERKGWQQMNAIKNKQVFEVDPDLVNRTGPRIIDGVEQLAKAVYPDAFK